MNLSLVSVWTYIIRISSKITKLVKEARKEKGPRAGALDLPTLGFMEREGTNKGTKK